MSYCRSGKDSDVYMFASIRGGWECCGCHLEKDLPIIHFKTRREALDHLYFHRQRGQKVPRSAIHRFKAELRREQGKKSIEIYFNFFDFEGWFCSAAYVPVCEEYVLMLGPFHIRIGPFTKTLETP